MKDGFRFFWVSIKSLFGKLFTIEDRKFLAQYLDKKEIRKRDKITFYLVLEITERAMVDPDCKHVIWTSTLSNRGPLSAWVINKLERIGYTVEIIENHTYHKEYSVFKISWR